MRSFQWLVIAFALAGCTASDERRQAKEPGGSAEVDQRGAVLESGLGLLGQWMTGTFSSAAQAAADSSYEDIRLEAARIWPGRGPGLWLYIEQWAAGRDELPYRQRVFHITALSDSAFRASTFTIPGSLRVARQVDDPDPLRALSPDSLRAREGCDLLLVRRERSFIGSTIGTDCRSELQGASHATSEVRITPELLYSWDRGFDDQGTQLWGPIAGGYEFRRVD